MVLDEWALPFTTYIEIIRLTSYNISHSCIAAAIDITLVIKFTDIPDMADVMEYVQNNGEFYLKNQNFLPIKLSDEGMC